MPVSISVKLTIGRQQREIMRRLEPQQLAMFMQQQGQRATEHIQRNVITMGSGGGQWAPLSAAYAKRKLAGRTPGHGRFGYSMLRDSGSMWSGLQTVLTVRSRHITMSVTSVGQKGNRPSNAELLKMHATGAGRLPVRNPASDMRRFQEQFQRSLEAFLAGRQL